MRVLVPTLALTGALLLGAPNHAMAAPPSSATSAAICLAPTSFAEIAAVARAAVVAIRPTSDTEVLEDVLDEWLEEEWGEDNPTKREEIRGELARALQRRSLGSGVIIDPSGVALTPP